MALRTIGIAFQTPSMIVQRDPAAPFERKPFFHRSFKKVFPARES
jgi:hypothetical protein